LWLVVYEQLSGCMGVGWMSG